MDDIIKTFQIKEKKNYCIIFQSSFPPSKHCMKQFRINKGQKGIILFVGQRDNCVSANWFFNGEKNSQSF